jgi:hypothetical protein
MPMAAILRRWGGANQTGRAGIYLTATGYNTDSGSNLTWDLKNNIVYDNYPRQLAFSSWIIANATHDYNQYYYTGSNVSTNNFSNADYGASISWNAYHVTNGNESHSAYSIPLFVSTSTPDYHLLYNSPAINTGTSFVGLTSDYAGNQIYGAPDIGAYEYQPPYIMGTNKIDIGSGAKIYGNGKFQNVNATSSVLADLAVAPATGFLPYAAPAVVPEWLDISNITAWNKTGDYHKHWTESSATIGSNPTLHTIGDLAPNNNYLVTVDGATSNISCTGGVCRSNDLGKITFTYTGGYSTHTFDIALGDNTAPTISTIATSTTLTTATITWTTNENSTSSVRYGTNINYNLASSSNTLASSSPSHSITLHNLATSTVYHFQIASTDIYGNRATTSDYVFTTLTPTYNITYTAGANGSLTGTNPQTVNYGLNGSAVTAVADFGYHFVNWSDNSVANPRIDTNVKGNISVTANFAAASGAGGGYGDRTTPIISSITTSTKTNSVTISWITNELSDSIIEFGLTTSYGKIISSPILALTHSLNIPDLLADTIYHYRLKSTDINSNITITPDNFFRTLLPVSTTTPESQEEKNEIATSSPNQEPIEEIKEGSKDNLSGATSAAVNEITAAEAQTLLAGKQPAELTEIEKIIYAKIIALSIKPLIQDDKYVIADFIHSGTLTTMSIGAGERGGSIASFNSAFGRLPESETDWQDVIKIANGRWPTQNSSTAEAKAKIQFKKIYLRNPDPANVHDSSALMIMAYGLRPAQRNLNSEKAAIKSFKFIFKKIPVSASDWDIVRAIAYSGAKR